MHHVTVVLAPFAETEPLRVAAEPLIDVAALVVADGALALIVIENVEVVLAPAESVTFIPIPDVVPAVVGVPLITPEELKESPAGSAPAVTCQDVYVPVPPFARICRLYAEPTLPLVKGDVVAILMDAAPVVKLTILPFVVPSVLLPITL